MVPAARAPIHAAALDFGEDFMARKPIGRHPPLSSRKSSNKPPVWAYMLELAAGCGWPVAPGAAPWYKCPVAVRRRPDPIGARMSGHSVEGATRRPVARRRLGRWL